MSESATCLRCGRAPRDAADRAAWTEHAGTHVCPGCVTLSESRASSADAAHGSSALGDVVVCADCGNSVPWHSDEAREWPAVEDGEAFATICVDCYRTRYGDDEADESERRTHDEQQDDRQP